MTKRNAPPSTDARKRRATPSAPKRPARRARPLHTLRRKRKLPDAERARLRAWAGERLDAFMQKAGIDPAQNTDSDGWRWFELGSAVGFAFVDEVGGEVILHVAAEVMPLPADRDLIVPLMRELLELNANIWGSARFGIRNRRIYACVAVPVADLDAEDFGVFINEVMALGDAMDDDLRKKYGGSTKERR
jgi:hypothetical protein